VHAGSRVRQLKTKPGCLTGKPLSAVPFELGNIILTTQDDFVSNQALSNPSPRSAVTVASWDCCISSTGASQWASGQ
jgi:hypothetical protein